MRYLQAADPDERRRRFEAVYAANFGPMLGYVLRRTENGDDAADVVAETFLTAWRRLDDVPPGDRARLWLYGVARRMLANHYRGERRKSELADRLRSDLAVTYLDQEYTGSLADIAAAFASLAGADRELLSLVAWEGLDNGEIASVLGCSRNAVRIRLHRARSRFAASLAREHVDPGPAHAHGRGREHVEPRPAHAHGREHVEPRPAYPRERVEPRPALAPIPSGETP